MFGCLLKRHRLNFLFSRRNMSWDAKPPVLRDMDSTLRRDLFHKTIPLVAVRISASRVGSVLKAPEMRKTILDLPKQRTAVTDPANPEQRLVLTRFSDEADLPSDAAQYLLKASQGLVKHEIHLDYDYWTADEILHSILPPELCDGSPSGFSLTGHIAHMNLNKEYLPYKHIIGQVILDKNKRVRTVVNKLDNIHHQFRFFEMELLAGEPDYVVEHHESDCRFTFDFTKVYWNSRLHTEHDRLVQLFKPEDVIADVFAGVGPFAIPAAKKGCAVLANDLNPESAKYLEQNIKDNKVSQFCRASCEDGKEFIRTIPENLWNKPVAAYTGPPLSRLQEKLKRRQQSDAASQTREPGLSPRRRIDHFVMNLPDSAITFLDAYNGILAGDNQLATIYDKMPMIHCYCFTKELERESAETDIRQRAEDSLGFPLSKEAAFHLVRSVAPNKVMYCVSFELPREVAFKT